MAPLASQALLRRALLTVFSPKVFTSGFTEHAWELQTHHWNAEISQVKQSNYLGVPNSLYLSQLII